MEIKRYYCGNCRRFRDHEVREKRKSLRIFEQIIAKVTRFYCFGYSGKYLRIHEDNIPAHKDYKCKDCGIRTHTVNSYDNRSK